MIDSILCGIARAAKVTPGNHCFKKASAQAAQR
jgi:hypothetical protein